MTFIEEHPEMANEVWEDVHIDDNGHFNMLPVEDVWGILNNHYVRKSMKNS